MTTKVFTKRPVLLAAVILIVGGMTGKTHAGIIEGVSLNAQARVDAVNSLNDGKGVYIDYYAPSISGFYRIMNMGDASQFADTSAYGFGDGDIFYTFSVEPNAPAYRYTYGTLNFDPLTGISQTVGMASSGELVHHSLAVGAAYLYKFYATGPGMMPQNMAWLSAAVRFLTGDIANYDQKYLGALPNDPYGWEGAQNPYIQMLLDLNGDIDYWMSDYNPDAYYTEIGNYSVFVMNTGYTWIDYLYGPDFLYIAGAADSYDPAATPEPTAMLIFGTGLCTLLFARRLRKNSPCGFRRFGVK